MSKIVANRIRTPDGTILQSFSRHDYKSYTDKNGLEYMVDGGLDYLRRTVHPEAMPEELTVYLNDPFCYIREAFHWGTYGKDGNQPLKWVALKDMETDHIEAILDMQTTQDYIREMFDKELEWRKDGKV